jgi:Icc-related predicted phosphoesterase
MSDLHCDYKPFTQKLDNSFDVLVVAGDVCEGVDSIKYLQELTQKPIVYVPGNHEYYRNCIITLKEELSRASSGTNITVLDDSMVTIGDICFLGGTLWTDYKLYNTEASSRFMASRALKDHRLIRIGKKEFTPAMALDLHIKTKKFLREKLKTVNPKKTVIVTHHLPSELSIPEMYKDSIINPAFASNLEKMILKYSPAAWIHGHTHSTSINKIGKTYVVCNPRGYAEENKDFSTKKEIIL